MRARGKNRLHIERDETIAEGLARVIQQLVAGVQEHLQSFPEEVDSIHQTRVAGKNLRAIAALLKKTLPKPAKQLNTEVRDIARLLSLQRDKEVKLQVIHRLLKDANETQQHLLQQLAAYHQASTIDQRIIEKNVQLAKEKALALAEIIHNWKFESIEEAKIIKALNNEYDQGKECYNKNKKDADPVDMHTWRKHAKTCLYQTLILQPHLKTKHTQRIDRLKKLGVLLGHYHDLVLIREDIHEPVITDWTEQEQSALEIYVETLQLKLLKKILRLGKSL
ncbi:MAG: CHAD domain-containing protein [Gammaproteobacteria bacterium]|nr:CHAD domain-containing protein [Gammaproteobacteria bacterium]